MNDEERTAQLRRIRAAENIGPIENAFRALLACTDDQVMAVVDRFNDLHARRDFTPHVVLTAQQHSPQAER